MKNIVVLSLILMLGGCSEEEIPSPEHISGACSTPATVRDLSGLDGCGYVFELSDGTRLVPIIVGYCGTPPLPKEVTSNPIYDFEFVNGKKVLISYKPSGGVTACMAGNSVTVTCISEVATDTGVEF